MAMLYVDCEGCRCLIRAEESQCPFCEHRPSVISNVGGSLRIFGLAAGLSAATMSCAAEDTMPGDTIAGEDTVNDDDADAVTYAGPDDGSITLTTYPSSTDPSSTDPTTTTSPDPTDADAVTYAGPDESDSTSQFPETTETTGTDTTSSGTDESSTGSSGTGDADPNG